MESRDEILFRSNCILRANGRLGGQPVRAVPRAAIEESDLLPHGALFLTSRTGGMGQSGRTKNLQGVVGR
jgi:hypothetical protein